MKMAMPPTSPRLPSPPPPTEIQIGPKSTSMARSHNEELLNVEQSVIEANSKRRIHPGTRAADMATGPSLIPLSELDSAFQLQEHLKALHYDCSKSSSHASIGPISREDARMIATPPEGVDKALWLYELCRFLINKCNDLILGFLFDDPPCSAKTCPEMRASEWQFLCAVHQIPRPCCAIDYCCHTLDWATNIVTSQKIFPSRLSLGAGDTIAERSVGVTHLTNIFRRLHRIFAHAWFQHRQVYWSVENSTGLYTLFKLVSDTYELLPAENYQLPPEAEGLEPATEMKPVMSILKPNVSPGDPLTPQEDFSFLMNRNNTRRHIRQSPSVGSAVTTVFEANEDDESTTKKIKPISTTMEENYAQISSCNADDYEENDWPGLRNDTEEDSGCETETGRDPEFSPTMYGLEPETLGETDNSAAYSEIFHNDQADCTTDKLQGEEEEIIAPNQNIEEESQVVITESL
ncbi:unnamed protein product [Blumeria hordei]|uniref:Mob1/phocein family protein n=1 Tax=Blumeria hordei TaxID=2867405 RepID=A0A383UP37_BLUHO|nr:unnamed protein product [Blumeria hordei]